jgi:hypothetical protein
VGLDQRGAIVLQLKSSREQLERRLANLPRCLIGMKPFLKRGESVGELEFSTSDNALRNGAGPCRTVMLRSIRNPLI